MIYEAAYIIFLIWLAFNNSKRIAADKKIHHAIQGAIHLTVAALLGYFVNWIYFPLILLTARLFFTTALNFFRHLPFFYVTTKPSAQIDKWEQKIFGNHGEQPFLLYLFLWLICNVILIAA